MRFRIEKSDDEWKKVLSPKQYGVLREKKTEIPFSGKHLHNIRTGQYVCAACGNELFHSTDKYDSGCGWPSFFDTLHQGSVELEPDESHGITRTEVLCSRCGGHLGHVFDDGPEPTGKRFCINSAAMKFVEDK